MTDRDDGSIPWSQWYGIAIVEFRWKPKRFWQTPVDEWIMLIDYLNAKHEAQSGGPPMTRDRIDELASQYPDTPNKRRMKPDG